MQIGFVGLGRMGGNMVQRILRDSDHQPLVWDLSSGISGRIGVARRAAARTRSRAW